MKFITRHDDAEVIVDVERHKQGYRVRIGERTVEVDLVKAGKYLQSLRFDDGRLYSLVHHREGNAHEVTLGGATLQVEVFDPLALRRKASADDMGAGGVVKALMPGRVVRVLVNQGDTVRKGAGLLILEAMKMENEIQAPADGVVDQLFVTPGQTVESGADLAHIS